jgi:hypothetical protein
LKPERESSSHPQSSGEPPGLLQILASVFSGVLFGLFLSKLIIPPQQPINSISPHAEDRNQNDSKELLTPLANQGPPVPQDDHRAHKCCQCKILWWKALLDVGMFVVTAGAFLAAVVYARITYHMQQDNLHAFRIDERAWVGIDPFKPILKVPETDKNSALFTYELYPRNTGKTAAREVEIRALRDSPVSSVSSGDDHPGMDRMQDGLLLNKFKNSADIPFLRSAPHTLAPGQVAPFPLIVSGQSPRHGFGSFLVGRIDYADEFGIKHWVKFCFFVSNYRGELEYCKYGNDQDNNPENP